MGFMSGRDNLSELMAILQGATDFFNVQTANASDRRRVAANSSL
jgi:hypothetical protein